METDKIETAVSKSELIEALEADVDYEGISEKLADENIRLRKAAEALWDGITGVLTQKDIDRVEQLYRTELALLLG